MHEWVNEAACRGKLPVSAFFPTTEDTNSLEAITICVDCPVLTACLTSRIDQPDRDEDHGVWGGTNPTDRERLRAHFSISQRKTGRTDIDHDELDELIAIHTDSLHYAIKNIREHPPEDPKKTGIVLRRAVGEYRKRLHWQKQATAR